MKFIPIPRTAGRRSSPRMTRQRIQFFLGGAGLLLIFFVLSFYLLFPTDALRERIEREFSVKTGADLTMAGLTLAFPPGLTADKVVITGLPGREKLEMASLTVKPLWLTLPTSDPGVRFLARLQGGEVDGEARDKGALSAQARQVSFAEPVAAGSGIRIAGTVRQGSYTGAVPVQPGTETRFDFGLEGVQLTGMEGLGVTGGIVPLGTVTLQGTGKGNAMRIDTLTASGGALNITGGGSLLIADPFARTRVNLNLTLRPGPSLDASLRDLLELFAQPAGDGSYRFRLGGTFASPVFTK